MKKIGIYIHIPFCKQKCSYCDFTSFANKEEKINEYIKALEKEIEYNSERVKDYLIDTIYIGGGTPSFIDSKYIFEILGLIKEKYELEDNSEITIEVNPGTVDKDKLLEYKKSGINRLSIGLQSTNNKILKEIGRVHTYEEFTKCYNLSRSVGFKNINVDLMLGLPNQTMEDLNKSINDVIKLNPEHISVYSLILEDNTLMKKNIENGIFTMPSEELERQMYWKTKEKLENAGYKHYEISNFAKEGFESKHNMNCWNQKEYLGFGLAAHSYLNNKRYCNVNKLDKYIENINKNEFKGNIQICEIQNEQDTKKEYMLLGLRIIDGVDIQKFKNKFGENPIYIYRKELEKLVNEELIEIDLNQIKLTDKGLDFANIVWEEFV